MTPKERTQQSVRDGYGGDTYRRREVAPGRYQCGCRWINTVDDPDARALGVSGDVLLLCVLHAAHSARELQ